MRMGQGVRTGLGHGGITCVLQTQFSSFFSFVPKYFEQHFSFYFLNDKIDNTPIVVF